MTERAFPVPPMPSAEGMSLHDWYTGMALVGLLASPGNWSLGDKKVVNSTMYAELALLAADAIMNERQKRRDAENA